MYETVDDLTAAWLGNGCELARRDLALADEIELMPAITPKEAAALIREVVRCEYDPVRDRRYDYTPLDLPLRPATPTNQHGAAGKKAEAGS
jgi:hypothetical protein